jgi:hypothetical protein
MSKAAIEKQERADLAAKAIALAEKFNRFFKAEGLADHIRATPGPRAVRFDAFYAQGKRPRRVADDGAAIPTGNADGQTYRIGPSQARALLARRHKQWPVFASV